MNEVRQRGPIARVFIGIWDAMNFTRRLVFNLVFFVVLLLILAAIGAGDRAKPLLQRTTLVIAPDSLPDELEVTAKTWHEEIMGVRHRTYAGGRAPLEGVQFHPESIMTGEGKAMLRNFLERS